MMIDNRDNRQWRIMVMIDKVVRLARTVPDSLAAEPHARVVKQ